MGHSGAINQTTGHIHADPVNQKVCISRLINSVYFSIKTCFIMTMTNKAEFRLLAVHGKKVLADRNYPTLRGARIAFRKIFKSLALIDGAVSEWSHFYPPDRDWIEKNLSIAANV